MDIKRAIIKIASGGNLTEEEAKSVFTGIMNGRAASSQLGAFLTALHMKGETIEEITGACLAMRQKALKLKLGPGSGDILDTCGTGAAGAGSFNISTCVAFVVAGCGVKVAKHGNRAASGKCGSADVLEELGVRLDVPLKVIKECVDKINIAFLFAPLFHKAMRYAAGPRGEIGIRTIFNVLGPLCSPVSASYQLMGVYDEKLTETIARVLKKLGSKRAFVVAGAGPLDEVTTIGKTRVSELIDGRVRSYYLYPETFGVKRANFNDLKGGTRKQNAGIIRDILSGKKGPKRDVVLANSSVALMAAGKARSFKEGMRLAAESIDSGRALEKLKKLIELTRRNSAI